MTGEVMTGERLCTGLSFPTYNSTRLVKSLLQILTPLWAGKMKTC